MDNKSQVNTSKKVKDKSNDAVQPAEKQVVLEHISPANSVKLQSALRSAGINMELSTTAVAYEIIMAFILHKGAITIDLIAEIVGQIATVPEFAHQQSVK